MLYWWNNLHHEVCQCTMSELTMNAHTNDTDDTTYTMLYVRSLCQIKWWKYTHMLLMILSKPWCMSDQYVWFNNECTLCDTDNTNYTMLYVRTLCQIQCWMYTHVLLNTLHTSWCMSDHHIRLNDECVYMNVLHVTLFTACCMSDHYVWFNDECTHMCYW